MDSLQPRDQVVDIRVEPDHVRAADSSMVLCRRDHPDEFNVPLDDPNEEITEQWQDGLQEWYTCRDDQCSVKSGRVFSGVPQRRRSNFCSCLKRRSVSVITNSQISTPRDCASHSASRGLVIVLPQKPSVVAWFQRCFRVSHLFGVPSPRIMDSTNWTHIPGISRAPTDGASVVGGNATTTKMMCFWVLMVGATSCLDRVVHAIPAVDAFPTVSPCVDIF